MSERDERPDNNHLLAGLSPEDFNLLAPHLRTVDLPLRLQLVQPGEPIRYSWFPHSGVISVVTAMPDGRQVEAGLIGCEGMVDIATLNGAEQASLLHVVQVAGTASRIGAPELRRAMATSESLRVRLALFSQSLTVQIAHTCFANAANTIEERLARWLLMGADRVGDRKALSMTHEFLSVMLGVRRSGVTIAVKALAKSGAIETGRGSITVVDRKRLQAISNQAYGPPEAEYARLLGLPHRSSLDGATAPA